MTREGVAFILHVKEALTDIFNCILSILENCLRKLEANLINVEILKNIHFCGHIYIYIYQL